MFFSHGLWKNLPPMMILLITHSSRFGWDGHDIKTFDVVPEREGEVCDKGVTFSDQEGAISSSGLCTVIMDESLSHHPALLHTTVKPWL